MAKEEKKNIFYHIKQITEVQDPNYLSTLNPDEYKEFNVFLIQKFLGLNNNLTHVISYIDKYVFLTQMTRERYYKLLINLIPKGRYWLDFAKKDKDKKPPTWFLELIKEYFKYISLSEALQYYELLSNRDKLSILRAFGQPEKKLKELIDESSNGE